jgi:group II intron reverse transcriptase/maturase
LSKAEYRQLTFAFADSPQGDGPAAPGDVSRGKAWLALKAKGKEGIYLAAWTADPGRLLEVVASVPNLAQALLNVARNQGAAGADGRSVDEVVAAAARLLPCLRRELLAGTYQPGDIRRVWIAKPGGGQRGLGIPNVVDRWVQQAVLHVLQPLFEPTFHASSHGFRPGRGAQTAIDEAKKYLAEGYRITVDIDLSKFFDRVHHQRLLNRLGQRVADGRILKLVHRMLKAKVVLPDGTRITTEAGAPQGGPLSPLLSNVVLDELDRELARRGLRFVRYADDFSVFVRSERAGRRVLGSVRKFIERRLRLVVNEQKSSVSRPNDLTFLGFQLGKAPAGQVTVTLSTRTEQRMATRIRALTPRTWGQSVADCIQQVNSYLRGWLGYFRLCTKEGIDSFGGFDAHIRRRIRAVIIRQQKRPRHLYRHLLARGVPGGTAATTAFQRRGVWHRSASYGIHKAYPNAWFADRLMSLKVGWHKLHPPEQVSYRQGDLFDPARS